MIKNMNISTKLYVLVALTSFVILAIGLYGLNNLDTVNNSLESVYKDRVIPLKQLKVVSDIRPPTLQLHNASQGILGGRFACGRLPPTG